MKNIILLLQEKNKAVARRVFDEIFNQGKYPAASEIYAPDFVNHGFSRDIGLQEDQAAARGWREAIPDIKVTVKMMMADGDLITVLWTADGTNTGQGNGCQRPAKKCEREESQSGASTMERFVRSGASVISCE